MTNWEDLERELDAWEEAHLQPTFWWRNDDVVKPTSALKRLLALSERHNVPVSLAVIPIRAHRSLKHLLSGYPLASVLQHGFSHRNHSPQGEPSCELSARRPVSEMIKEIEEGRRKLHEMFPGQGFDVLVPPWGRINETILPALVDADFIGISMGEESGPNSVQGLRCVNVHVDIVDWSARAEGFTGTLAKAARLAGISHPISRSFVGLSNVLDQILHHLSRRRVGEASVAEPTGVMTHHHANDEDCWDFINSFLSRTCAYTSVQWLSAEKLFSDRD